MIWSDALANLSVVLSERLHPMLMPSGALAVLSVGGAGGAAPDAEAVGCTGDIV